MKLRKLLITAAIGFSTQSVLAHGAWLAERLDAPTIVYGEGARDNAYSPEKITYAQAFDAEGKPTFAFVKKNENNVAFDKDSKFSSAAFVLTNGFYTKTEEEGYIKKPHNEVDEKLTIIKSFYSVKVGIGIVDKGLLPSIDQLNNLPLVIYPDTELHEIEPGKEITLTVLFNGKPIEGVSISHEYVTDHSLKSTTDVNGEVTFKVHNDGLNVVKVGYKIDTEGEMKEKAQQYSYSSTLSFVAKSNNED